MNSTRLSIVTFFGLLGVYLVVGGIGGWILFSEVEDSHRRLQLEGDRQYGHRIAAALSSQIAMGMEPGQVLDHVSRTLTQTPSEATRYLCVVTGGGMVLSHPRASLVGRDLSGMEVVTGPEKIPITFREWSYDQDGEAYVLDARGRSVEMIQSFPVIGTDWQVLMHSDLHALRREAWQLNNTILAVMIPMGALLVLLGTLMVRTIGRSYERAIEDANRKLENRVRERTRQLERTIQELERTRGALVLREKMALLGQLVAGIAHEINNPLWSIELQASELQENAATETEQDAAKRILQGTRRCSLLVRNLLSFARNEPPHKTPEQLHDLLETALSFCAAELRRAGIHLEKHLAGEDIVLQADRTQIEQVILNLITNAIQALEQRPEGRRIRIETRSRDDNAIIIVEDNGPGVAEELEPHLFEPFRTTKAEGEGTGLGLSLCRQFVRHHEGGIHHERSQLGGARFVIQLPLARRQTVTPKDHEDSPAYIG